MITTQQPFSQKGKNGKKGFITLAKAVGLIKSTIFIVLKPTMAQFNKTFLPVTNGSIKKNIKDPNSGNSFSWK